MGTPAAAVFNPDSYLQTPTDQPSATFDPDAHLTTGVLPAPIKTPPPKTETPRNMLGFDVNEELRTGKISGTDLLDIPASIIQNTGAGIIGGFRGLTELATTPGSFATRLDAAADAVRSELATRGYKPETPEGAEVLRRASTVAELPQRALQAAGGRTLEATGSPAAATAVEVGPQALAMLYGTRGGAAAFGERGAAATSVPETVAGTKLQAGDVPVPEPLRVVEQPPRTVPMEPVTPSGTPLAIQPSGVRAPAYEPSDVARPAAEAYTAEAPTASDGMVLPQAEQARRLRVAQEVGNTGPIRDSALTGDRMAAGTDAQIAKVDSPAGRHLASSFDEERRAVSDYTRQTVEDTGGRVGEAGGDTQTDAIARGRTVPAALNALDEHLEGAIRAGYSAADAAAQGKALPGMGKLQDMLEDEAQFHNFEGGDRLLSGVRQKMINLKMMDDNGNMLPTTVRNAEALRQYINSGDGAYPLRAKFRDAIDNDVFSQSGSNIYAQWRQLYKFRKDTLENPNGINRIMSAEGPEGLNRKTPYQDVMQRIETMDPDQSAHVVRTLRSMVEDPDAKMSGLAQTALDNIQAHFASRLYNIGNSSTVPGGMWNAKGVTDFLRNNSDTLNTVFADKPELLHRLYTANEYGKIFRYNAGYPGAAAQAKNLMRAGVMPEMIAGASKMAGAAGGGFIGTAAGPTGTAAGAIAGAKLGESIGSKLGGAATEAAALKAAQARTSLWEKLQ